MRIFFLVLAVATAISAHKVCTPHSFFRNECNNCKCAPDGSLSFCTQRVCPPGFFNSDGSLLVPLSIIHQIIPDATEIEIIPAEKVDEVQTLYVKVCTPKSFFHIGCNKCRCSHLGERYTCTQRDCAKHPVHVPHPHDHHPDHHRIARSVEEKECEPGTTYYDYCNVCQCGEEGKHDICTKMACDKHVFNKNGTLKYPYNEIITPIF